MATDPEDIVFAYSPGMTGAAIYVNGRRVFANDTDEALEHLLLFLGIDTRYDQKIHPPSCWRWDDVYETLSQLEEANRD